MIKHTTRKKEKKKEILAFLNDCIVDAGRPQPMALQNKCIKSTNEIPKGANNFSGMRVQIGSVHGKCLTKTTTMTRFVTSF